MSLRVEWRDNSNILRRGIILSYVQGHQDTKAVVLTDGHGHSQRRLETVNIALLKPMGLTIDIN